MASRDHVMLHFARISFIAFASVTTGCSSERPQKEPERKEIAQQLTSAYYTCVRTSFTSQLPTMVDRNMAIDQAFKVCQTEESKLQTFENALSENVSNAAISAHRTRSKKNSCGVRRARLRLQGCDRLQTFSPAR
jgi:hypothetical protein